ncbi:MAG: SpoIID/LytB domain-containing protein, partial [Bdellovibrionota bacterium]
NLRIPHAKREIFSLALFWPVVDNRRGMMRPLPGIRPDIRIVLWLFFTTQFAISIDTWAMIVPPKLMSSKIRVRVAEALPVAKVRGFDLRFFTAAPKPVELIQRSVVSLRPVESGALKLVFLSDKASEWNVYCQSGRIRAQRTSLDGSVVAEKTLEIKEPAVITSPAGFLKLGDKTYREELRVHASGSFCEVVNYVDIEVYLGGVVNSEFSAKWNEDAIGAQVIAARTYAAYKILQARLSPSEPHYDLDATVRDQVYDGAEKEDPRATRIVAKSSGVILTAGSERAPKPIQAFYHSMCGGGTELPQNVWRGGSKPGFGRPVRCDFCKNAKKFLWNVTLGGFDIETAVRVAVASGERIPATWFTPQALEVVKRGKLVDVQITKADQAGRVGSLRRPGV